MLRSKLRSIVPHAQFPLVANGPMIGAACPALAAEVSKAGGLGFIASVVDVSAGSEQLSKLEEDIQECRELLRNHIDLISRLPIGISFLSSHKSIGLFKETALPIVKAHKPLAVWLFAPQESIKPHAEIIAALKGLETPPVVFVQVGHLTAAREAVRDGADVVVCQGSDAGGHQYVRGSGVFTVAHESVYPEFRKEMVLKTTDGGTQTLKSSFNDRINNNPIWAHISHTYDGRAIIGPLHERFMSGSSLEECQEALRTEYTEEEAKKIISTWAGTGVGLVEKTQPAAEIVREVRKEAVETLKRATELI
ncbi:Nitronate monooxygenase-like protein [Emericellopsis cladophorae]|uniref:Nitronate monooxygenase-like protein n=1 Tax=Emericellopsis cladophorae TaxID=2686198 RepID=A0A9Q0BGE1_9HYPO|nr:Nitronate monooxygenase-like protein [Emericellopsis cladophorae]KAI6784417.1 Nitronate monooxygenase-like protein [Emericellopsis cladophorae]